ncbi:MAG: hypothetical protein RL557_36 [archaeon]|jgi:hypothetical protein
MSVQELNDEERILFLQEFVESIIISLYKESASKEVIESEKIKIKYLQQNKPFESFGAMIPFVNNNKQETIDKKEYTRSTFPARIPQKNALALPLTRIAPVRIPFHPVQPPQKVQPSPFSSIKFIQQSAPMQPQQQNNSQLLQPRPSAQSTPPQTTTTPQPVKTPSTVSPSTSPNPLAKIELLVKDQGIQLIECPGANKFILVKVRNKINTTKITLTEEEIKGVVDYFAQQARVPIIGGILKAAVDDMLISAVSSNYIGSRFIITKKSPYSLIEGQI